MMNTLVKMQKNIISSTKKEKKKPDYQGFNDYILQFLDKTIAEQYQAVADGSEKFNIPKSEAKEILNTYLKEKEEKEKERKEEESKEETDKNKKFDEKEYYDKYIDKITCAYKSDIYIDQDGGERCGAKRSQEREKYLFKGLNDNVVLIECPKDMLVIEFETHDSTNTRTITKDKIKEFVKKTANKTKEFGLDYCIASHGGTSDYVYVCNIENILEGKERDIKKEIAKKIIPKEAQDFLDLSNLGKTLIPIINRPHWKKKKYNGTIHKIIQGKNPNKQKNKVPDSILQKFIYQDRPKVRKEGYEEEENINEIPLTDILSTSGLKKRGNEYQGSNPWHGSDTGMNFAINTTKNVWHCFRCNVGGSSAQAIALNRGIISQCDEKLNSEQFKEVLKIAQEMYGLKPKKEKDVENKIGAFLDKSELAQEIWKIQPYFYDASKIWWLWDKETKRWKEVDEVDVLNMVSSKSYANTVKSNERQEIIESMKQHGRIKKPKAPGNKWIQFQNTIYDLDTDKKFEATPEYFVTNPIPWKIGESEETPELDKLFEEWVGKDYIKTLKEICAYCMLPDYPIHRLFCLIGEGSNGKSKFLEFVMNLVGMENITSTELEDLIGVRFEKAKLYKKSVCMMGETNFSNLRRTSLIKKLTGQDSIGGEKKNKNPFDFVNYAKLLISTNGLPYTEDKSDGFFRRWCIINFPNKFKETNNVLGRIPQYEYNNLCNKSISLLKELLQKMKFHNEGSVEERKSKYNEFSNPINKFIEDECKVGEGYKMPFFKFFEELNRYVKNNGYRELSKVEVSRTLHREGFQVKTERVDRYNGTSSTWKMVTGIELNYEGTERYEIKKDISNFALPEQLKDKNVGDIIVFDPEIKSLIETLEKDGYISFLGSTYGKK